MVKFGKNKIKALNKLAKKQKSVTGAGGEVSNKIIKKKQNIEKKVTFQKEILLKQGVEESPLVKKVKKSEILNFTELLKDDVKNSSKDSTVIKEKKPKNKHVEKQKKRQKTLINDTKLLLKLMSKK